MLHTATYLSYKQSLLKSFVYHYSRHTSIPKITFQRSSNSDYTHPLVYTREITNLQKVRTVPYYITNFSPRLTKVTQPLTSNGSLFKPSKAWALRKKWKRRSSQRHLVKLMKVNNLFWRFLRTKLHLNSRKPSVNKPSVNFVKWYQIFWKSSGRTKTPFNVNLQPILQLTTHTSPVVSQLRFSAYVKFQLKSVVKPTIFFTTSNKLRLPYITTKTPASIKHNLSTSRHNLQSNFGLNFARNMYFFTYILQTKATNVKWLE